MLLPWWWYLFAFTNFHWVNTCQFENCTAIQNKTERICVFFFWNFKKNSLFIMINQMDSTTGYNFTPNWFPKISSSLLISINITIHLMIQIFQHLLHKSNVKNFTFDVILYPDKLILSSKCQFSCAIRRIFTLVRLIVETFSYTMISLV